MTWRGSSAHEEGGERVYAVNTSEFVGDGSGTVSGLRVSEVEMVDGRFTAVEGTEREIPAQLVLLAMGFTGPETCGCLLYTSDAADDLLCVDLGGRRIIK